MAKTYQLVKSILDTSGPINFDKLRESTEEVGPLRMSHEGNPYVIEIQVVPCRCADEGCAEQLVIVWRRNGLFSIRWVLSRETLLEYESLDDFRLHVLAGALDDTFGKRQLIEFEIEQSFGRHFSEVEPITGCFCDTCVEAVGKENIARQMLLSQMAMQLRLRQGCIDEVREAFGEDAEDVVRWAFDIGYQTGRIYSEYQVKEDIEEHAIAGMNFEELKVERARRAGEKSSGKRAQRIESLLAHMERLASSSPELLRIGPESLAKMAREDASAENPALWSQGKGQVGEYLGLMRRGEVGDELRARYLSLFPAKSPACLKSA